MSLSDLVRKVWADKVEDVWVPIIGNRITAATFAFMGASTVGVLMDNTPLMPDNDMSIFITYTSWATAQVFSLFFLGITGCGLTTREIYKKTRKHIQNHGYLDSYFAKKVLSGNDVDCVLGYCTIQGMYLAAAREGQTPSFREYHKQYSVNKIPNF